MISIMSSLFDPKAVQIPDLLHELCLVEARKDNFSRRIHGVPLLDPYDNCERVSISAPREVVLLGDLSVRRDILSIRSTQRRSSCC